MMVKICGITNSSDARAAVDAGASALGFNFYPASPRYIAPEQAAPIIATLPAHVWAAGVFVDEYPGEILRIARETGLHIAQLHGHETPAAYPPGLRVWKALRIADGDPPPTLDCPAEAVLLDGPASGENFDWSRIPRSAARLILAGGLDAANVRSAIEQVHPWGVDACSRLESSPGRKDHIKMAEFLKAALAAAS
jgi:phosphoribosylanthranilate isomerase